LLSTHLLHEAALICSHATIINKGRVLSSGLLSDIEKRFQMTNTVVAKVMRWNEGLQSQVQSQLGLSVEKIDGIEGEMTVRLSGASGDMREQISKLLVDHGAGLMGLAQEKADLEMIFKSLTGGRQG
jgi:ABC-type multidrug transport system ATPase subunit